MIQNQASSSGGERERRQKFSLVDKVTFYKSSKHQYLQSSELRKPQIPITGQVRYIDSLKYLQSYGLLKLDCKDILTILNGKSTISLIYYARHDASSTIALFPFCASMVTSKCLIQGKAARTYPSANFCLQVIWTQILFLLSHGRQSPDTPGNIYHLLWLRRCGIAK